ncbi:MAG: hypothetical protein HY865_17565 [Chloroflexi bacterium]|nr:hypothetical protein [Chloroflexota bacterium]
MTLPLLFFALLIALLCGAVFHILRGGSGWRLLLYLVLSVAGFSAGQALSMWRGWGLLTFGALDIGAGLAGSLIFMALGEWLGRVKGGDENRV